MSFLPATLRRATPYRHLSPWLILLSGATRYPGVRALIRRAPPPEHNHQDYQTNMDRSIFTSAIGTWCQRLSPVAPHFVIARTAKTLAPFACDGGDV